MVDIKKCIAFNKNCGGMLKRSVQLEIANHDGASICSSAFTNGLVRRKLAEAPISTSELNLLLANM